MTAEPTPEELLSAYLDDELGATEAAEVEDWLAADPSRRDVLDGLAAVRRQVRELPWLDMPAGIAGARSPLLGGPRRLGATLARRSNAAAVLTATMAVVVLAGALVLGGGRPAEATDVPVEEVVQLHRGTWPSIPGDQTATLDTTAPPAVDHYYVVGITRHRGMTGLHYRDVDGSGALTIFEARGRVRWSSLGDGEWGEIDGDRTWMGSQDGYDVLVLQRRGRVYVVISDDRDYAEEVSREMPGEGEPSLWGRVTRRCHDTLHLFSGR